MGINFFQHCLAKQQFYILVISIHLLMKIAFGSISKKFLLSPILENVSVRKKTGMVARAIILALGKLGQKDLRFESSLGYMEFDYCPLETSELIEGGREEGNNGSSFFL